MTDEVQVIWKSARHVLVRQGPIFVQIRGEEHSVAAIEAEQTGLQLARAQIRSPRIGALLVIEEDAPAPTGEVAERQRWIVQRFVADTRVYVSVVFEGTGAGVALKRTIARALFRGSRRHLSGSVAEGARWLAAALEEPAREREMIELVATLRRDFE